MLKFCKNQSAISDGLMKLSIGRESGDGATRVSRPGGDGDGKRRKKHRAGRKVKATGMIPIESVALGSYVTEAMVRDFLKDRPKVLGLGDNVEAVTREHSQPDRGGSLDLLLEDKSNPNNFKRYSVEIQLGELDESHIVRAIGYWDWERARFPDYEHHAVLVVEGLGRFFNVVYHINRQPQTKLTVILMTAVLQFRDPDDPGNAELQSPHSGKVGIHFRKILTSAMWGIEDAPPPEANREFWMAKNEKFVVEAEKFLDIGFSTSEQETEWEFNYTRPYIGLKRDGRPTAAVTVWPRVNALRVEARHEESDEVKAEIAKLDPDVSYARSSFMFNVPFGKIGDKKTKTLLMFLRARLFSDSVPDPESAGGSDDGESAG